MNITVIFRRLAKSRSLRIVNLLGLSVASVSWQSWQASVQNPAEVVKSER